MSESKLVDTINMTGLDAGVNHLPDEFIKFLLGIRLDPGGWSQITYITIHKVYIMLW